MDNGLPGRGLLVDRIEINDFRLFKNFRVERFGRVNLIVGKNGAGKTSLLEALRILATVGAPHVLWEIVKSRNEQPLLLTFVALYNPKA
jgi:recombinational DNA repair ATPase RecF